MHRRLAYLKHNFMLQASNTRSSSEANLMIFVLHKFLHGAYVYTGCVEYLSMYFRYMINITYIDIYISKSLFYRLFLNFHYKRK
jgi:hypothetical protein